MPTLFIVHSAGLVQLTVASVQDKQNRLEALLNHLWLHHVLVENLYIVKKQIRSIITRNLRVRLT